MGRAPDTMVIFIADINWRYKIHFLREIICYLQKKKCSHANICSGYSTLSVHLLSPSAAYGWLRRNVSTGSALTSWVSKTAIGGGTDTRPVAGCDPGWMTDPIYLICTGLALLWVIFFRKAPYSSAQYILYIRHHRSGTVYGGGRGQEPGAGPSFLGGHYHGRHHRKRGAV